ncbi:MAG: hypothetical protein WBB47_01245 [Paenisporosarcina sp.]
MCSFFMVALAMSGFVSTIGGFLSTISAKDMAIGGFLTTMSGSLSTIGGLPKMETSSFRGCP